MKKKEERHKKEKKESMERTFPFHKTDDNKNILSTSPMRGSKIENGWSILPRVLKRLTKGKEFLDKKKDGTKAETKYTTFLPKA